MKDLSTAQEFLLSGLNPNATGGLDTIDFKYAEEKLIEFANIHIKSALESAYIATKTEEWIDGFINLKYKLCKKNIINSYPLLNIKQYE